VLEFAAGFGRVTRFLATWHGAQRVTAAEIQKPATEFLSEQFGVRTLLSPAHAADFDPQRRFAVVVAHSFFSHTPEHALREWLGRLYELVQPGGVLVFSVHDESLIAPEDRHQSGLTFRPVSESDRLQSALYGSTWVSAGFVEAAVRAECPGATLHRWPRGLTNYQDLYVASERPIAPGVVLDQGPFGFFSITRMRGEELDLIGWAAHRDPARSVDAIVVSINGRVVDETKSFFARSDVVTLTGEERHRVSGWRSRFRLPEGCSQSTDVLLIKAPSDTGAETILYVGTIANALLESCRAELAAAGRESVVFPTEDTPDELFGPRGTSML
jgi:SAM-dependent methyltransferase